MTSFGDSPVYAKPNGGDPRLVGLNPGVFRLLSEEKVVGHLFVRWEWVEQNGRLLVRLFLRPEMWMQMLEWVAILEGDLPVEEKVWEDAPADYRTVVSEIELGRFRIGNGKVYRLERVTKSVANELLRVNSEILGEKYSRTN